MAYRPVAGGEACSFAAKETEIKLTNVARATLDELMEDYLDHLKNRGLAVCPSTDGRAVFARAFAREHNDWADWSEIFETRPAETLANLMLTVCNQTSYLLAKMIERQEADFKAFGGVRERMHTARTAVRGESFEKGLYSCLAEAESPEKLAERVRELRQKIDRAAWSIRRKKGWD